MALLARCRLIRAAPSQRVGVLGLSGLRLGARSLSASASAPADGSKTPTKEELIASYPIRFPFGQNCKFDTPTGPLYYKFPDAPGVNQYKLHLANTDAAPTPIPQHALMIPGKSGRIAHKLFAAARDGNLLDAVLPALDKTQERLKTDMEVRSYLHHPLNTSEMRAKFLRDTVMAQGSPACVADAVVSLLIQKRLRKLRDVRRMVGRLLEEHRKEKYGIIISAEPLSEQQYTAITAKMQKLVKPGENLVIDRHIDPEVIGGLVIRVGSIMQDLSVSTQILRLETHLKGFFSSNQRAVDKILGK